jgi:GNAT superfamily N-acetyltransferase
LEAATLHEELKTTPNILGYSPGELESFRDVLVAEVEGAFAGACVSKDLLFGWTEIAILYVLPAFRGMRLGRALFAEAWQRAEARERHIVVLSRSPETIHLMEGFEMEIYRAMWKAPLAMHLHMNRHMSNWYRLREAVRKSRVMKVEHALVVGVRRRAP